MSPLDDRESSLLAASTIGPYAAELVEFMWQQAARAVYSDCHLLHCYARRYSPARVEAVIHALIERNVRDLASLRYIIDNNLDCPLYDELNSSAIDCDGQQLLPFQPPLPPYPHDPWRWNPIDFVEP